MDRNRTKNFMMTVLAAVVLTAGTPSTSYAQEYISTPVSISKEKVRAGGKVCYSHIVLEKQTLFSIAKAYNVTIEDIYAVNPTLKETGLKKNSIILIPTQESAAKTDAPAVETSPEPETAVAAETAVKTDEAKDQAQEGQNTYSKMVRGPGRDCRKIWRKCRGHNESQQPQRKETCEKAETYHS